MKVTKDFYNHHSRSMKLRIDMYHNVLNHPDTLEELQSISSKHSNERNAKGNDLLDLYNNENKLLKVAENFATTMKNSEDEAELEAFDAQFQEFGKHMKTIEEKEISTFKRAYKSKEGDRTLNKIMDRIYTDLSSEYDKRIYNPPENSENITAKLESLKQGVDRAESDNTEEDTRQTKQSRGSKKVWSNLEIVNLLKGIYQYGEPKWQEIHSSYEFNDKTPHDLSVKWMDLRYQISEQQKRLENTSSKKSNQSRFPQISKDKNGGFDRNGEIQEYSEEPKNWLIKSEKKIMTPVPDSKGVFNKIPILDNSAKPLPRSTEEDPQMLHWLEMIKRRMPIFRIKKNASRDDISDSSSNFDERGRYKRRRLNSEGEYESCSDYAGDSIICPKIMYGTINTIYKDSIQIADTESNPGLVDLGKKYYSKSLFIIDKSQHKKILKRKRKEELKIKKKMEHKEEMRKKKEQQKKLMVMLNEKEAENKAENEGSTKQKITKKRVLKKI